MTKYIILVLAAVLLMPTPVSAKVTNRSCPDLALGSIQIKQNSKVIQLKMMLGSVTKSLRARLVYTINGKPVRKVIESQGYEEGSILGYAEDTAPIKPSWRGKTMTIEYYVSDKKCVALETTTFKVHR